MVYSPDKDLILFNQQEDVDHYSAFFSGQTEESQRKIGPATSGANYAQASCMNSYVGHYWAKFFFRSRNSCACTTHFSFVKKCNFLLLVVRVHPISWDQLGPLQNSGKFLFSIVRELEPPPLLILAIFCRGWSELFFVWAEIRKNGGGVRVRPIFLDYIALTPSILTFFCRGWSELIFVGAEIRKNGGGGPSSTNLFGPARISPRFCVFCWDWSELIFVGAKIRKNRRGSEFVQSFWTSSDLSPFLRFFVRAGPS